MMWSLTLSSLAGRVGWFSFPSALWPGTDIRIEINGTDGTAGNVWRNPYDLEV